MKAKNHKHRYSAATISRLTAKGVMCYLLCCLLFAAGCHSAETSVPVDAVAKDTLPYPDPPLLRTDVDVVPLTQFPAGFQLDTLLQEDSARGYKVDAYYPKAAGNEDFNRQMARLLKKRINYCRPKQEKNEPDYAYLDFWIVRFELGAKSIQCTFCEQTYYEGAAHYNLDTVRFTFHIKR